MFTGLVQDLGEVLEVRSLGHGLRARIRTALDLSDFQQGESVAVDGVCLTVESWDAEAFQVAVGRETVERTTLGSLQRGRRVHLERALRLADRLGGHLVQGHVDGVGRVVSARDDRESRVAWIEAPSALARYIAEKGSIAVDGISLTVNEVVGSRFRVNLVPHTLAVTAAGEWRAGRAVNLEVDLLARYVERLLGQDGGRLDMERLAQLGLKGAPEAS